MSLEGLQGGRNQIAANPLQGKGAFDAFEAGTSVRLADPIEIAPSDDQRTQSLDDFPSQPIAQAGTFPGRAEEKQAVDAARQNVFDEPFEAGRIELVVAKQGGDQGRKDAAGDHGKSGRLTGRSGGASEFERDSAPARTCAAGLP